VIENSTVKTIIQLSSGLRPLPDRDLFQELLEYLMEAPNPTLHNLLPIIMQCKPNDYEIPFPLRIRHLQLISHHLRQIQWIKRFQDSLSAAGMEIILLKGHGLLASIYSPEYPRLSTDIDLLAKPADYSEILGIISANATFYGSTRLHSSYIVEYPYAIQVEVHSQIDALSAFNLDFASIWADSNSHPFFNSSCIRAMSLEDSLIHIIIHGFNQYKFHPYMIVDAARITAQKNFNFDKALLRARNSGCEYLFRKFFERFSEYLPEAPLRATTAIRTNQYRDRLYDSFFKSEIIRQSDVLKPFLRFALVDKKLNRLRTLKDAFRSAVLRQIKKIKA
jgi:hypothetical protein